jgi:predicted metal-dependent hydrolase
MKTITINNLVIPLKIVPKNNKHTYFYFNEPGVIKVHLSKRHTEKFIKTFIKKNEKAMYQKYILNNQKEKFDSHALYYFGNQFQLVEKRVEKVRIDTNESIIFIPKNNIDHKEKLLLEIQKEWMQNFVDELIEKYRNNPYVDIKNVSYRFSFMKSRYGSCNANKRKIHLNLHLLKLNKVFTEYIFLHEITHLKIQNHSSDFYDLLSKLCPNYKDLRKQLRKKKLW